jgi:hypothetical protein
MKALKLLLPESTLAAFENLAQSVGGSIEQYCSALLIESAEKTQETATNNDMITHNHVTNGVELPDTVIQVLAICRHIWFDHLDFNTAVPKVATAFSVHSTTVRDKCTRRISMPDVPIGTDDFLRLLSRPAALRDHLCLKFPKHKAEIIRRFDLLIPGKIESANPVVNTPPLRPARRVTRQEMIRDIISYLKSRGGLSPKIDVEDALFEKLKDAFQDPFYLEPVGGGVPRWKKNLQFARNAARETGLIKEASERGIWELTEKGWQCKFDSE